MRIVRDYEVSIWTLQDSFITVLKPYGIELKGQLQEPDLKIVDDGTLEFTFNLPMYYTLNGEWLKNPLWNNVINGIIVANMRKIKIIFKKHQQGEKVIELMITKVTESHDKDQLMCEVSCEGLAFHELGKLGYKIALETDDLIEENTEWFKGDMSGPEPRGTLQYWNDKVFKLVSGNWKWNWTYEIQMDYNNNPGKNLDSSKVYEDAYVSSWDYDSNSKMVVAQAYVDNAEKERVVDLKESNVYNLTQDLAKTFGVFCRYEYEHDENYHICGRKVIYYNNFLLESLGALDITYPYDTSVISRTSDSTDLVTKLYVQTDGSNNDGEPITITNSSANKTKEDYILNFDYLWRTGAITQEQYAAARQFEIDIYRINNELIPIQNQIIALEAEKPELEAKVIIRKNSITLDQERMSAADDLLNALTNNTGILEVTNLNPKTGIIITSKKADGSKETYANITELGIDIKTLKVYKNYNSGTHELSDNYLFTPVFDEFQNLVQLKDFKLKNSNLPLEENDSPRIYMTYQYTPDLYYERVIQIWQQRMKNDTIELQNAEDRLKEIDHLLNGYKDDEEVHHEGYYEKRDALIEEKNLAISRLERVMGAALREGYWQPEDYNDYGDKHLDNYSCAITDQIFNNIDDTNANAAVTKFFYDTTVFDNEQKSYLDSFTIDGEDTTIDYPCIEITSTIAEWIQNRSDAFSLIFYDVVDVDPAHKKDAYRKIYHIGSQCQYAFIKDNNNNVIPVIMVTGAINDYLTNIQLQGMAGVREGADTRLAVIDPLTGTVALDENKQPIPTLPLSQNNWYNKVVTEDNGETTISFNETIMVYPRIQITSLNIRTDNDEILVKYNGHNLENYEDYQLLIRDNSYYINLKPEIFARYGFSGSGQIQYIVSNANTMIYLDALQVSKENSQPKVEYSVTVNAINKDFIEEDYNYLGYIAHINDTDLKFENVYGYVSELHLKLDKAWEDEVTIKNYKTKFEDLFTSIVAQTEQMQKNSTTIGNVGALFDAKGDLIPSSIEKGINKLDLSEAFNKGTLTWDDAEGLWASSDSGVVAIRGGGIFSATQKNPDGSWHWNTGFTPEGINADLITTGQLDTNRIKVYAGDELRLQLNADGLFAYKTGWDGEVKTDDVVDYKQYVVHDASGLFLIAENGAQYKDNEFLNTAEIDEEQKPTTYADNVGLHNHKDGSLERVAISWDGLTLRNWAGQRVFYANPDTGDLVLIGDITANNGTFNGTVNAANGNIGGWTIGTNQLYSGNNNNYVALNSDSTNTYAIWAGATNAETTDNDSTTYAPFSVSKTGQLRASDAIISGAITATSLTIGNQSADDWLNASINDEAIWLGVKNYTNTNATSIKLTDSSVEISSTGALKVSTSNVIINTEANNNESIFKLTDGAGSNPINYFNIQKNNLGVVTAQLGGWLIGEHRLASGNENSTSYVALDSTPNGTYAIWCGDSTANSAPFRVTRTGNVYLNSLMVLDKVTNGKWEITKTTPGTNDNHYDKYTEDDIQYGYTPIQFSKLNFNQAVVVSLTCSGTSITTKGVFLGTWTTTATKSATATMGTVTTSGSSQAYGWGTADITVNISDSAGSLLFEGVNINATAIANSAWSQAVECIDYTDGATTVRVPSSSGGGSGQYATTNLDITPTYTAGQNSVKIVKSGWSGGRISFSKSAGTDDVKTISLSQGTTSWNGDTASIPVLDGGGSTGYTFSVDASDRYNAGYNAGRNSVDSGSFSQASITRTGNNSGILSCTVKLENNQFVTVSGTVSWS